MMPCMMMPFATTRDHSALSEQQAPQKRQRLQ
jgi:hypothetical protein